ncbi:PREDICTED: putative [Prunus dulcis]|uniref:PREDICTED: putative n=1 Tax=Prunus dulcis TaxID=3755 RepID=A0A5E4FJE6_PRUDU|nr:hypothetical protein L3X38_013664 [Prunus dulcis]VVA27369.1 PREDICTED: putative [Prunus dulcis]
MQIRHCFRGKEKTSPQGKPKHKEEDQYQNAMVTNQNHRPYLPDDMIYQILRRLPTKAAVRTSTLSKQWEGVWSLLPSLDFDEGGNPDNCFRHNDVVDTENLLRHKRFVNNILAKCLEYRQEHKKQKDVLDKLKIHMEWYSAKGDVTLINKWLDFSFETV